MPPPPCAGRQRGGSPLLLLPLLLAGPAASFCPQQRPPTAPRCWDRRPGMIRESDSFGGGGPPSPLPPEVLGDADLDGYGPYGDAEEDWVSDLEKAGRAERTNLRRAGASPPPPGGARGQEGRTADAAAAGGGAEDADGEGAVGDFFGPGGGGGTDHRRYSEEDRALIDAMGGGTTLETPGPKREAGFLGDSTLREISLDFQVPVCYLADVLCTWGVPLPVNVNDRLGDLVTGEMAFAMAEAIHTLDSGEINDSYSNLSLDDLCHEYGVDLKDAFDLCVRESWNLPFGVKTFLRVDQEDKLLRALSDELIY